jgi:hypothetical protein
MLIACLMLVSDLIFACGTERWPVKTATDKDKAAIVATSVPATVNQLSQVPAPIDPSIKRDTRYAPTELAVYEITARMTFIKVETDEDYHIVLKDEKGHSMIVESVAPNCAQDSRFKNEIKDVRDAIDKALGTIDKPKTVSRMVTVTGVGFFDRIHGQTGVASNGIELHPIIGIVFHDAGSHTELRNKLQSPAERE